MHESKSTSDSKAPPVIPTKLTTTKSVKFKPDSHCAACLLAKQHQRGNHSTKVVVNPTKANAISPVPGRLPLTKGQEPSTRRYNGGTIFYDHYSGHISVQCQISLGAGETVQSKRKYMRYCNRFGVQVRHFRADNHPF